MHLAPRSGAYDLRSAARTSTEIRRNKLSHVLHVRGDPGRRSHATRVDKGKYFTRTVRHAASVGNGQSGNILIHARGVHVERFENVTVNIVGPAFTAHLLDQHSGYRISEIGALPPHRRGARPLPIGVQSSKLIGSRKH